MQVNFENGVSPQVVETMLGEVMDSMEFAGAIPKEKQSDYEIDSETIFEICKAVSGILNRKFSNQPVNKSGLQS